MGQKLPISLKRLVALLFQKQPLSILLQTAVRLFAPTHRIGVMVIVMSADQRVLLLNHVLHSTIPWGAPGGWLDKNEDPAQGVLRELHDETGLSGTLGPLLLMERSPYPAHLGIAYLMVVETTVPLDALRLSNEIISADWFALENLPQRLTPFTRKAILLAKETLENMLN